MSFLEELRWRRVMLPETLHTVVEGMGTEEVDAQAILPVHDALHVGHAESPAAHAEGFG